MGKGSSFLVFFRGEPSIDQAERALRAGGLTVVRESNALIVRWGDGPSLSVGLSTEPHVVLEAGEIAERRRVPALAACERRFEVSFDDLEAVLDEMNTLAEVQMTLQDLTGGYVLMSWNGELQEPG